MKNSPEFLLSELIEFLDVWTLFWIYEEAPGTNKIGELYKLFEQMQNDPGTRLAQLEHKSPNNSLINQIQKKYVEINRLRTAIAEAVKQQTVIQKVVDDHQSFLKKTDTYRREQKSFSRSCLKLFLRKRNAVIYGLAESTELSDADQVKEVLGAEMKCEDTVTEKHLHLGIIQDITNQRTEERQPLDLDHSLLSVRQVGE